MLSRSFQSLAKNLSYSKVILFRYCQELSRGPDFTILDRLTSIEVPRICNPSPLH